MTVQKDNPDSYINPRHSLSTQPSPGHTNYCQLSRVQGLGFRVKTLEKDGQLPHLLQLGSLPLRETEIHDHHMKVLQDKPYKMMQNVLNHAPPGSVFTVTIRGFR